jgi:hypothetical protein
MDGSGPDGNRGANTAQGDSFQWHSGVQRESYGEAREDEAYHDVALHRNFTERGVRNHSAGVADLGRSGRGFDLRGEDCPATDQQA